MIFIDMLTDFIQNQSALSFILIKFWIRFRPGQLIFILVSCFDIFVVESASNAHLEYQNALLTTATFFVPKFDFWIQALGWNIKSGESLPNLLD